jgi:acetyltransferase-like isoleucine patch superfamily enzyme
MHILRLARLRLRPRVTVRGRVRLGRGVRVAVARGARVVLERGCRLDDGCRIEASGGTVRIGRGAHVGERAVIVALAAVEVGERAVIGDWALLCDAEPTFEDPERPTRLQPLRAAPVQLGDGARIGPHAAVMAGVTVRPGAVVQPYEVVEDRATESRSRS